MKILENLEQGSIQWLTERLWRLTASSATANISASTGKLSKSQTAIKSIDKLIAGIDLANVMYEDPEYFAGMKEWELRKFMADYTGDAFAGSSHTERGNKLEPEAIEALSERIGEEIKTVGMCVMGDSDNGVVSCSPDGLIYDSNGDLIAGVEVKCPCLCTFNGYAVNKVLPDSYKLQVHFSMVVCGLDTWHFGAYFPDRPLFYVEVKRDEYTESIKKSLEQFEEQYRSRYNAIETALEELGGPYV